MKRLLPAFLSLLAFTACVNLDPAPDRSRHFTLAATAGSGADNRPTLALVVMPVGIPDYLKRSNVVLRRSADELEVSEQDRWAEPVENGIARVVAENLTALMNSRFIRTSDQPGARTDELRLQLSVIEFTTNPEGEARVVIETKLQDARGERVLTASRTRLTTEAVEPPADTAKAVAALSETLRRYSEQVAGLLRQTR